MKDLSPKIYKEYTGCDNVRVFENLKEIALREQQHKVFVRLPHIPHFNTLEDTENSKKILSTLVFTNIEVFRYSNPKDLRVLENKSQGIQGKITCEVLKKIRLAVTQKYNIDYKSCDCHNTICVEGTCKACNDELLYLTLKINNNNGTKI